ncbi:MAG: hypothetical protein QXX77_08985 [Candidatus Methanosuratincola sp.]
MCEGLGKLIRVIFSKPKKEYGIKSQTLEGEDVRSVGEKRIADFFTRNGINYVYEKSAKTHGILFSNTISHPDFYLPDHDVYVEYWGLVDADDTRVKDDYISQMKWKMAQYHKHNIKFISIYPNNLDNLDWVFRQKFKKVTGYDLP